MEFNGSLSRPAGHRVVLERVGNSAFPEIFYVVPAKRNVGFGACAGMNPERCLLFPSGSRNWALPIFLGEYDAALRVIPGVVLVGLQDGKLDAVETSQAHPA